MWHKKYMGYVREILAYLLYPFAPKSRPQKKFVIFTVGRSGSTLLVSLLHSHASIFCDDELFRRKLFSPLCYLKVKERLNKKNAYGFKLNTYHFRVQKIPDPAFLLKSIVDMGYVIISLERRNLLRQVISHMHAVQTDQFHLRGAESRRKPGQINIDIHQLEQELNLFEGYQALQYKLLEPYSYLRIIYEDDLLISSQHQSTVDRVCNFLGIPAAKVVSNLKKTTPTDLSHLVVNYSQVEKYLETTKYAGQLDED
jgi:LPS sulfotransferase NodH